MSLGNRLRAARKEAGLLQKQVADAMGVSAMAISRYETGEREPDIEMLIKLAAYFGVTTDYLLGSTDDPGVVKINAHMSEDLYGSARGKAVSRSDDIIELDPEWTIGLVAPADADSISWLAIYTLFRSGHPDVLAGYIQMLHENGKNKTISYVEFLLRKQEEKGSQLTIEEHVGFYNEFIKSQ